MKADGVILYGPPGSGKDTITAELNHLDDRFTLVTKLKFGSGRPTGYKMVSEAELTELREAGRLLVETRRYGNVYAVDHSDVAQLAASGKVPVLHMGNVADLARLSSAISTRWLTVMLWITREVCEKRSQQRGDTDTTRRLEAWDETRADVEGYASEIFDLILRTDQTEPSEAARAIALKAGYC